jgi:hypothetical protein
MAKIHPGTQGECVNAQLRGLWGCETLGYKGFCYTQIWAQDHGIFWLSIEERNADYCVKSLALFKSDIYSNLL